MPIERALLSVYDKTGIVELAHELHAHSVEILSTGGTAKALKDAGLPVTDISEYTNFPEMMDGRVKTLHPLVHGGILNRRDNPNDREKMQQYGIKNIDMVVVNLYPFGKIVQNPNVTWEEAIENIDIGGPALLRSAAKNHLYTTVLTDPADYGLVVELLHMHGEIPPEQRRRLAIKALNHTAFYDAQISSWLETYRSDGLQTYSTEYSLGLLHQKDLRYGENPHQTAALYRQLHIYQPSLLTAKQLRGKELSYNNYNDGNAALEIVLEFDEPVAVAVKHANPCAVASGSNIAEAFKRCYEADPVSIYGGIVALNRPVDALTAEQMKSVFLDIVIAPSFSDEALQILTHKKNLILLEMGPHEEWVKAKYYHLQKIRGGFLMQSPDIMDDEVRNWKTATAISPTKAEMSDLIFAWKVAKHVRSNAIVIAKHGQTIGMGIGQVNRVDATRIALRQAGERASGAVLASDGYIPFDDSIIEAGSYDISAIIQPGGSVRDADCIATANDLEIAMVFTGRRHFRH